LWQIADLKGIPYPAGAAKTKMIPLLEDVSDTEIIEIMGRLEAPVRQVMQKDDMGNMHIELYPDEPQHYSADRQERVQAILSDRLTVEEQKEKDFSDKRLSALEKENADLKKLINERLDSLMEADEDASEESAPAPQFPLNKLLPWQLIHLCKDKGIKYKGLSTEEMVAALEA